LNKKNKTLNYTKIWYLISYILIIFNEVKKLTPLIQGSYVPLISKGTKRVYKASRARYVAKRDEAATLQSRTPKTNQWLDHHT